MKQEKGLVQEWFPKDVWDQVPQPSTLNPQPSTLNHQPSTLNPQPSTLNPPPSTLNPQPSTLNPDQYWANLGVTAENGCFYRWGKANWENLVQDLDLSWMPKAHHLLRMYTDRVLAPYMRVNFRKVCIFLEIIFHKMAPRTR